MKWESSVSMRQGAQWFSMQTCIPTQTLSGSVILDKLLSYSMPQSPHL